MLIRFNKYQATGNDFVILDNQSEHFPKENNKLISRLCDRRFGVGADGLILIEKSSTSEFKMLYFNADGGLGSLCGNGSRAAVHYANSLGLITDSGAFEAYDGPHQATIIGDSIQIKMADVQNGSKVLGGIFIDTGSPHYVEFCANLDSMSINTVGKPLRHNKVFSPEGTNVNFVEVLAPNQIKVRTYERGVENETLSCGTGVTASALLTAKSLGSHLLEITTLGGNLKVEFEKTETGFKNIWLEGPAELVYTGEIEMS